VSDLTLPQMAPDGAAGRSRSPYRLSSVNHYQHINAMLNKGGTQNKTLS